MSGQTAEVSVNVSFSHDEPPAKTARLDYTVETDRRILVDSTVNNDQQPVETIDCAYTVESSSRVEREDHIVSLNEGEFAKAAITITLIEDITA